MRRPPALTRRPALAPVWCSASLLLLVGCQTAAPTPAVAAAAPTSPRHVKAAPPKHRAHRPPRATGTPVETENAEVPEKAPVTVVGLSPEQLEGLFGAPGAKNVQGPRQEWVYRSGSCTLKVSLYPDVGTREFRSLSYEVSGDDHSERGEQRCLGELANRSAGAPAR